MSNNIIPVVFTFDKRIILGASVAIKSLIDCAKETTTYDIRIFHSDLDVKTQNDISKLTKGTRHQIAFHYVNPEIFKNAPHNNHSWTEIVYYRFLVPNLLPEYEKAIYSDVDVLFKYDLSELYNTDLDGFIFGAVRAEKNSPNMVCHKYFEENTKEYVYWSGLLLINNTDFNKNNTLTKLIENAEKYYNDLKFYDLDLMNITCNNIKILDFKYCVLQSIYYNSDFSKSNDYKSLTKIYSDEELQKAKGNPAIIHYAGNPGKPWRMKHPYDDYQKYINELPLSLKRYSFRDIRKKIFG